MKGLHKVLAAGVAVATLFAMGACGASSSEQEKDPKTLKIWHYEEASGAQGKAWDKAIELFEKSMALRSSSRRSRLNRYARMLLRF